MSAVLMGKLIIMGSYPDLIPAKAGLKMNYYASNGNNAMGAINFAILFSVTRQANLRIRMSIWVSLIGEYLHFQYWIDYINPFYKIELKVVHDIEKRL